MTVKTKKTTTRKGRGDASSKPLPAKHKKLPDGTWDTPTGKHPGGRPTDYRPEFCQSAIDFFDQEPYETINETQIPRKLPTVVGFARHIKVALSSVYNWMDHEHPCFQQKFMETLKGLVKDYQKEFIIQNGLMGLYNANFAKFVAVNVTDMRDKTEQGVTVTTIDDVIKEIEEKGEK